MHMCCCYCIPEVAVFIKCPSGPHDATDAGSDFTDPFCHLVGTWNHFRTVFGERSMSASLTGARNPLWC